METVFILRRIFVSCLVTTGCEYPLDIKIYGLIFVSGARKKNLCRKRLHFMNNEFVLVPVLGVKVWVVVMIVIIVLLIVALVALSIYGRKIAETSGKHTERDRGMKTECVIAYS